MTVTMPTTAPPASLSVLCLQADLARGLAQVARAVGARSWLSVLGHVRLTTGGGRLTLAATNLEFAITTWVGGAVERAGAITVPARLLMDFVSSLPNDRVALQADPSAQALHVRCARARATIKGGDADDFPIIPAVDGPPLVRVDAGRLREMIGQVVFAAAGGDSRPVLAGVHLKVDGTRLTLAAADGYRLSVRSGEVVDAATDEAGLIVPARALIELARLLADRSEPVALTVTPDRSQVRFRAGAVDLVVRLIEGAFPEYEALIPTAYATRATADTEEVLAAVRRAAAFARDDQGAVRLSLRPGDGDDGAGRLIVAATAAEVGDQTGEVDADVDGPAGEIAFNVRFLSEALGAIRADRVALEMQGPTQPAVLRLVGDPAFTHILMPIHLMPR